jgi:G8 domain
MQESRANSAACGRRGRVFVIVRWSLAIASLVLVVRQSGAGAESLSAAINGPNDSGICGVAAAPLSACKADADNNLEVRANGCGPSVYVDKRNAGPFNTITIDAGATLCFPDEPSTMTVSTILVNGLLQIGQKTHPIGTNDPLKPPITLNFVGSRPNGCAAGTNCPGFSKGIQVQAAGSLQIYGLKGVPPSGLNWTYLLQPAGPPKDYGQGTGVTVPVGADGADTLRLVDDVTQGTGRWQTGDWIAVGGTSFSPFDTEIVRILSIVSKPSDNPTGSDITLAGGSRLVHYHFGSQAPEPAATYPSSASYNDGPLQNYGVDERAPVALLTRNIKLTSTIANTDPANLHWGGEMRFLGGLVGAPIFKEVSIQGVEIEKFGKDQLGSYPIHFHIDGDASKATTLVDSNSIHHSYDKCATVHSTRNLTISNTVCVRAVGHLFYEEIGDEQNITFANNLGIGAMSNSFDINGNSKFSRTTLIKDYWWTGDNLASEIDYDGFNIPDLDATSNPTHGSCTSFLANGALGGYVPPLAAGGCPSASPVYIEPASGFWVTNPGTKLTGNIIDGCQGVGVGYWYVPPPLPSTNQYLKVGTFRNNRVSACFDGLFGEGAYSLSSSSLLHPTVDGTSATRNLLAQFDGLTASRIRDRGVWMRDQWFVVNNGRFATSRDSASLLTAGGIDGATPGDWMLVENSVLEGISQNNVDRFGPCALPDTTFSGQTAMTGCIDVTPTQTGTPHSGEEIGKGYPDPNWNTFGYLIYDGPARLIHDRFVNFKKSPALTNADAAALTAWAKAHFLTDIDGNKKPWVYEGDAAFGWFQSNQSSYPTLANSSQLSFVNTDLRHQIYTELVNLGKDPSNPSSGFGDGDKNTAVIDLDGTLAGFDAADAANNVSQRFDGAHPISLNGLIINASSNSVDECLAEGAQDTVLENRPTALMSPSSMATLEVQMLYPPCNGSQYPGCTAKPIAPPGLQKQAITFTKDAEDSAFVPAHDAMTLTSRNALGVWEPKVTSGLSYTVTTAIDTADKGNAAGIAKVLELGVVDAYKPNISSMNPFYVRIGLCYASANGKPANKSAFTIARGYHSYGGGTVGAGPDDLELRAYYNKLSNLYVDSSGNHQVCDNLVGNTLLPGGVPINLQCPSNPVPGTCPFNWPGVGNTLGCPANGITLASAGCPTGTTMVTDNRGQAACLYPTDTLVSADSLSDITNSDGTYNKSPDESGRTGLDKFYYDASTGWLFLYVAQQNLNAEGPSPLANCKDQATPDPSCPNNANGETYYVCPPEGCRGYVITVTDPDYSPGPSTCPDPYAAGLGAPEPPALYHLTLTGTNGMTSVVRNPIAGAFPHYAASSATAPVCQ